MVDFPSNGGTASGYLATPESGAGLPLVVIHEWWGLSPHIRDVADRFAAEGYVALVPDLYHGEATTEPSEADRLMMTLQLDQAGRDMSGAIDRVAEIAGSDRVGVTGFCMGGGLALILATQRPDKVKAVSPWYGVILWPDAEPDWSRLDAAVRGHYAANDEIFTPEMAASLERRLRDLGKDARLHVVPGANHAFFNDTRPNHHPEAAAACWKETLDFLRETLA